MAFTDRLPLRERHPTTVMDLNLGVSDPPTAFEVQTIAHKVDELLAALRRP